MEAAQALADLTEISSQIESAVLAGADGSVAGSTFDDAARAGSVAEAALELLREAEQSRTEGTAGLVQIQAATPEGCVFVVRDGEHVIAAVTKPDPTVGLVFYDLKTCLRLFGEEEQTKAQQPSKKAEPAQAEAEKTEAKKTTKKTETKKQKKAEKAETTTPTSDPANEETGGEG